MKVCFNPTFLQTSGCRNWWEITMRYDNDQLSWSIKRSAWMMWMRLHMCRIMNRVDVRRRLSMMTRIMRPRTRGTRRTVKLMMLLGGPGTDTHWNLHRCWHRVVTGRQDGRTGDISGRRSRPLGRTLHPTGYSNAGGLALVGLTISEALSERIAGDLQLSYPVILVCGHRGEPGLRKGKRLEIFRARIRCWTERRGCDYHVAARLITMHRVQDNLQRVKRSTVSTCAERMWFYEQLYRILCSCCEFFINQIWQTRQ